MRQGSNTGRRPRGRTNRKQHGGGGGGQSRTHTFDSNGPDGRVRGNARQVYEKYLTLARDATSAGDRIAAEGYFQHAEHYFRILAESTDPTASGRRPEERPPQPYGHDDGYDGSDEDDDAPVNGHGGGQRQHEARGNGNAAPQGHRDQRPREAAPRQAQASGQAPEQAQGQAPERAPDQAPEQAGPAPAESPARSQAQPASGDGGAARPRRGRPRKPRANDEGEPQQDSSSETESGPVS